jgi:futalosine hydrolase
MLITGVGMHRMSYALGRTFAKGTPDFCVNAGIAGAFPGKAALGEVVHVSTEVIADLGAEDQDGSLLTTQTLGMEEDISCSTGLINRTAGRYSFLRTVKGITTNTAHGYDPSIRKLIAAWDPDVETQEGGAFFYCCLKESVPFIEVRAISNFVEPRNRESWNIPLAVKNLNGQLIELMNFFIT